MTDQLVEHWFTWIEAGAMPNHIALPDVRRAFVDQLFLRMSQATEQFLPWLREVIHLPGCRILEIGGGAGSSTAALVRAGASVTSVDISEDFIDISKARLSALDLPDARFITAPENWLQSDKLAEEIFNQIGEVDIIVCYALFEHLLIEERLRLLDAIKTRMKSNRALKLVIWETPNRMFPFDWHTTRCIFPDVVPDEIASRYIKLNSAVPPWKIGGPWDKGEEGKLEWARLGRGMSFHELDVTLGTGNYKVIQDGYWRKLPNEDMQIFYKPNGAYETALENVFASMSPPVHRGFCRPSLNLVIEYV